MLVPHLPASKERGRPRRHAVRESLKVIFYILRSGGAWRLWPHDLPSWETVYHDSRLRRVQGRWERLHGALHAAAREQMGRDPQPTAAIIDSPSVTTGMVGGPRGYYSGKQVNGRKHPLPVDTQGLLIRAAVHPADMVDWQGAKRLSAPWPGQLPRLRHIWADSAYRGKARE